MKILHVITSLHIGGAEKLLTEICPLLVQKGHEVDVLTFNGKDTFYKKTLENKGVRILYFCKKDSYYDFRYVFKLMRIIRNYDVIHTHLTAPQLFCAIANVFHSRTLVTTEHNTTNSRRGNILYSLVDGWMYSQYQSIICISDKTEENLKTILKNKVSKLLTINNGINVKKYKKANRLNLRNIDDDKVIVTMVAAFRIQKDQETLINAIKYLDSSNYSLWLVGDGEKRNHLVNYIKDQGVEEQVFLWGNRDDVPSILKTSDIVVMSSHWEGFGLAAVEGMAAGKPVLATDVDGLAQVVGGAGILFPHEDYKTLAREIQHLAEDKNYYSRIATQCSERAKDFDIQKMVDGYEEVYKKLINED